MPSPTKKPKAKKAKKKPVRVWQGTALRLLLLTGLLGATLAMAVYFIFIGHEPKSLKPADSPSRFQTPEFFEQKKSAPVAARKTDAPTGQKAPEHEKILAPQQPKTAVAEPEKHPAPAAAPARPKVAIIIDDMGYQKALGEALLALDLDLTFAFLPQAPYARPMADTASRHDRDILLHQPLDPVDPQWKLGPGAITLTMTGRQMETVLAANLAALPLAIGVNNHMGSRFLENKAATRTLMRLIKDRELFFVDSQTSSNALGFPVAKEMGLMAASRNVFLDNDNDDTSVQTQLSKLLEIAHRKGSAIGIGHPKQATLNILRRFAASTRTVQVVGVRHLLR